MLGWSFLFGPKGPPPGSEGKGQPAVAGGPGTPGAQPGAAAAGGPAASTPAVVPAAPNASEELVTLETAQFQATLSSWGGALRGFMLKNPKFQRKGEDGKSWQAIDLVSVTVGEGYPLALAVAPGQGAVDPVKSADLRGPMRVAEKGPDHVTFEGEVGPFLVSKRFSIGSRPYELTLDVTARPKAGSSVEGRSLVLAMTGYLPPETPKPGFLSGGQAGETLVPACRAGDKTVRGNDKEAVQVPQGAASWVGMDRRYFVSAVMGPSREGECVLVKGETPGTWLAGLKLAAGSLESSKRFTFYSGPKQLDSLQAYGRDLESAIDYGTVTNFFAFFARALLWVMRWFEKVVRNWGFAIILLTFLVKLVLYPLTHKSMQSMQEMRALQPEVEKLKAKFGEDKEKMNVAVMDLYKKHGVNPLGGCLPMLLQMPIWLALYATLQTSVELYREPFFWIRDLTAMDPYYILPVAMGVSSFVTQKLSPQPADNAQAKMMLYMMPIFFTFIMFKLPAGLTLYILVNNLLSIVQQQIAMRRTKAPVPAKA